MNRQPSCFTCLNRREVTIYEPAPGGEYAYSYICPQCGGRQAGQYTGSVTGLGDDRYVPLPARAPSRLAITTEDAYRHRIERASTPA